MLSSYFYNSMCLFMVQYLNMINLDVQAPAVYLTLTFNKPKTPLLYEPDNPFQS